MSSETKKTGCFQFEEKFVSKLLEAYTCRRKQQKSEKEELRLVKINLYLFDLRTTKTFLNAQ